jgi:hypothetical protein
MYSATGVAWPDAREGSIRSVTLHIRLLTGEWVVYSWIEEAILERDHDKSR